jgi:lipoate-protein ligase A
MPARRRARRAEPAVILWLDGGHDAAENMRRDRVLLERVSAPRAGRPAPVPALRLFTFDPPGITLGHAQDPATTIDAGRCHDMGVTWAVRPTGGRAILHASEWTFSVSASIADPVWGGSTSVVYDAVSNWIHASLVHLGVPAERVPGLRRAASDGTDRTACFAATARHEIVVEGRKLAGIAQRRTGAGWLQQGSVLLGPGHERLADCVRDTADRRERLRTALASGTAFLTRHLAGVPYLARWEAALFATAPCRVRRVTSHAMPEELTVFESHSYTRAAS